MLNARLSRIALGVEDLESAARFYEDKVGLSRTDGGVDRVSFGLGRGAHVLELRPGQGLDHFGLELADEDYRQLAGRLAAAGVECEARESSVTGTEVLRFRDPDSHAVEIHRPLESKATVVGRSRPHLVGLHHVTISTGDVPALVEFYTEILGFAVSDRMGEKFAWLRCNREHHTLAIVQGESAGLDHYCYAVSDWEALKVWCDELAAADVPVAWGPGRHGPGNNLFIMFDDIDGVHIELSCEMERFWDDRVEYAAPRDWAAELRTVNLWGPTPDWRAPLRSA
jgi:catechol 2,3-dioxygenase